MNGAGRRSSLSGEERNGWRDWHALHRALGIELPLNVSGQRASVIAFVWRENSQVDESEGSLGEHDAYPGKHDGGADALGEGESRC